ncbi:MAG: hypothetical protein QOF78_3923 [Phycisphaerales bacterium]|jgi:hypothetical protein|nr:hypothetical protein [Phycisphaerales bacterium]
MGSVCICVHLWLTQLLLFIESDLAYSIGGMKCFPRAGAIALAVMLLVASSSAMAEVEVTRKPPAAVTKTFDPSRPPKEMPPLRPGEAAVCESKFLCQVQVEVEISSAPGERPECKIVGIKSELRLDVVIWLPTDATHKIRVHEDGHRQISERFYAQAEEVAKKLGAKYVGKELEIKSSEQAETRPIIQRVANEFCQEYLGTIEVPSEKVQMKYDQLTDHGRNKLSEREAIRRALAATGFPTTRIATTTPSVTPTR